MMKYKVFEHKADVGLHVYGPSIKELFENAGLALFEQIADLSTVDASDEIEISASGDSGEERFISGIFLIRDFRVRS